MRLCFAAVLVASIGTAAPAHTIEGKYHSVGPRQRYPLYDRPVPAWSTSAEVKRTGADYAISITTVRPSGCTGQVTAKGVLTGRKIIAVAQEERECKLAVQFKGDVMRVREQGTKCYMLHGMRCDFDSTLKRAR